MEIKTKFIILNGENMEKELLINKTYEFQESNYVPQIGRLVSISNEKITFDCSNKYYSNIRSFELHRIQIIREID